MIYNKVLNTSFTNDTTWYVGGAKRLFMLPSLYLRGYSLTNMQITTMDTSGESVSVWEKLENLMYSVKTENSKSGTLYSVEISFGIPGVKAEVSALLDLLINNEISAIVEDLNGRFILLGFRQGLISTYDYDSESSAYSVKMVTKQMMKPEEVSAPVMQSLELNEDTVGSTPSQVYTPPMSGSTGTASGNVLKTVTVTTDNYQVQSTDHFILIPAAYTVLLPSSPVDGQEHKFKATYDASVLPVVILPGGSARIDANVDFQIVTFQGSVSMIYKAGNWHTVAFIF